MLTKKIVELLEGGYPLIHILTYDYVNAKQRVVRAIKEFNKTHKADFSIMVKGPTGWVTSRGERVVAKMGLGLSGIKDGTVAILYLPNTNVSEEFIEAALNIYESDKEIYLVTIGPNIVPALKSYFVAVDWLYPEEKEIKEVVDIFLRERLPHADEHIRKVLPFLKGLTLVEIVDALTAYYYGGLKLERLWSYKDQLLLKSGLLEAIRNTIPLEQIGGLTPLKEWLRTIKYGIENRRKLLERNMFPPRGCLLAGFPGTGKSFMAKAIAHEFNLPLYRLDIGRLMGSYVGDTERNTREVLSLMKNLSPAVVLIDEIEKTMSGHKAGGDSGVMARLLGSLLYFMQEENEGIFFVFTCNDVTALPPELLRRGRLDELWFISFPSFEERLDIWTIKLKQSKFKVKDEIIEQLAGETEGFTGAEIEQVIRNAFIRGKGRLILKFLHDEIRDTVSLKEILRTTGQFQKWEGILYANAFRKANS